MTSESTPFRPQMKFDLNISQGKGMSEDSSRCTYCSQVVRRTDQAHDARKITAHALRIHRSMSGKHARAYVRASGVQAHGGIHVCMYICVKTYKHV